MKYTELAFDTIDYFDNIITKYRYNRIEEIEHDLYLSDTKTQNANIYIHIPFCTESCTFCAFKDNLESPKKVNLNIFCNNILKEIQMLIKMAKIEKHNISSIYIGGGSPNLLDEHIETLLSGLKKLDEVSPDTEISVELSINSVSDLFLNKLIKHKIQRVSFGVQSFDECVRLAMGLKHLSGESIERLLGIASSIPVINADLITCFPGQSPDSSLKDIDKLLDYEQINSISSYYFNLLSQKKYFQEMIRSNNATNFFNFLPMKEQIRARYESIKKIYHRGWVRSGTCTYTTIEARKTFSSGNECFGVWSYNDVLIGVGPSAVSYLRGIRLRNVRNVFSWGDHIENNIIPIDIEQSFFIPNPDLEFWNFPLSRNGINKNYINEMIMKNNISFEQIQTFNNLINDGYIYENNNTYFLTIMGEVFMGNIIEDLRKKSSS